MGIPNSIRPWTGSTASLSCAIFIPILWVNDRTEWRRSHITTWVTWEEAVYRYISEWNLSLSSPRRILLLTYISSLVVVCSLSTARKSWAACSFQRSFDERPLFSCGTSIFCLHWKLYVSSQSRQLKNTTWFEFELHGWCWLADNYKLAECLYIESMLVTVGWVS